MTETNAFEDCAFYSGSAYGIQISQLAELTITNCVFYNNTLNIDAASHSKVDPFLFLTQNSVLS